ncbi:MAG: hypothetical protein MUO54_10295, partial [Anaerolineales bacterium]|nr:hypothetical protein [Anaerolineales bacterium]
MKKICQIGILLLILFSSGCRQTIHPLVNSRPDRFDKRNLLTASDLLNGFDFTGPINEAALAVPEIHDLPLSTFEGRLELLGEVELGERIIYSGGVLSEETNHLPEFDFEFVQHEGYLIPVRRGLIITEHKSWNFHLEPGKVWSEPGDGGFSRASFPFALTWKGSNAILNGTMTFLFNEKDISKVWYQVTQETTISTSLDLWGLLDATYYPESIPNSEIIKAEFSQ